MDQASKSWRPPVGQHVALSDEQLAKIGMAAVLEAQALSLLTCAIRAVARLDLDGWKKRQRRPMAELTKELLPLAQALDPTLHGHVDALEVARLKYHDLRHSVVHSAWSSSNGDDSAPAAYDYGRTKLLGEAEIDAAVEGCAQLRVLAHVVAYRVAELVAEGALPERQEGPGISMRTTDRLVRL